MPSPSRDTVMPVHSSAKSRSRSGCSSFTCPIVSAAMLVAIDGPAGAGKSTVARAVARALGFTYLDSGAMYRCVALAWPRDPETPRHPLRGRARAARRGGRQRGDPHAGDLPAGLAARDRPGRARGDARQAARADRRAATGWPRAATSAPSSRRTPSSRSGSPRRGGARAAPRTAGRGGPRARRARRRARALADDGRRRRDRGRHHRADHRRGRRRGSSGWWGERAR